VAVATRMILVLGLTARLTGIDMPSQRKGATSLNGSHRVIGQIG
jgi:hypothetical protein